MKVERTEILLDQICTELADIKRKLNPKPIQSPPENPERLDDLDKGLILVNQNLITLGERFRELESEVFHWKPIHEVEHHHEHVFFPGFITWLDAFKRWKISMALIAVIVLSVLLNVKWYQENDLYYKGFLRSYMIENYELQPREILDYIEENSIRFYEYSDSIFQKEQERSRLQEQIEKLKRMDNQ